MSKPKTRVVVTRKLPDRIETRLMELFAPKLNFDDAPMDDPTLHAAMAEAEVLVPTVTDRIDGAAIAAAGPDLKLIASYGAGVDHIDLAAAAAKGIVVTNTPGVLTDDTADMTMALILAVARRVVDGAALARSGEWMGWGPTAMLGRRITGKRLGVLGMGRIGAAVARRARGFGLQIHYHNRQPAHPELEAQLEATYWDNLDQMLPRVDILSVNCPHTPATYHLLNARRLDLLQPDAVIVNTARGEVIDEPALAAKLKQREIAGAGLDVYEREPAIHPDLLAAPNTVLLPHMGSATVEGRLAMGERVLINIQAFVDGHTPPDRVIDRGV
ncbi:MAG: D-glycerate dehydrogenase [Pseudomonadota bacterium]